MIARSAQGKLLVFFVFVIGIATGVLSANLYRTRVVESAKVMENPRQERLSPQDRFKQDFDRMANYLGLDQDQRAEIQKISEETRSSFRALREKTEPQFKALEETSRAKVLAVLNEEQRQKYKEFRETHPGPGGPRGRGPRQSGNNNDNKR